MWYHEVGAKYVNNGTKYFRRNIYVESAKINDIRKQFQNTDIYASVFRYNNVDLDQSDLAGPFYLDFDTTINSETEYKALKQDVFRTIQYLEKDFGIDKTKIQLFFSGSKGFHLLIDQKVFGLKPSKDLCKQYKAMAVYIKDKTRAQTIDTKIYDNRRLFRIPNSINGSTGLYKKEITIEQFQTYSLSDMREFAKTHGVSTVQKHECVTKARTKALEIWATEEDKYKNKRIIKKNTNAIKKPLYPCTHKILNKKILEGERNVTLAMLSSMLFQAGYSFEEVVSIVEDWNGDNVRPAIPQKEVLTTIRSMNSLVESGKGFGCSAVEAQGFCRKACCPLYFKERTR